MLLRSWRRGGWPTDSAGTVDFRNAIRIMTSNIGWTMIKGGEPSFGLRPKAGRGSRAELPADQGNGHEGTGAALLPTFIGRLGRHGSLPSAELIIFA